MQQECHITAFTTSKCVDNLWFLKEFDGVITQYEFKYKAIHFNNGLHCVNLPPEEFEAAYDKAVAHILETYPECRLSLALCTPSYEGEGLSRPHSMLYNLAVERNAVINKIAQKYGLPVDDLFTPMEGRPELHVPDGIHFKAEGYEILGRKASEFIRGQIK